MNVGLTEPGWALATYIGVPFQSNLTPLCFLQRE